MGEVERLVAKLQQLRSDADSAEERAASVTEEAKELAQVHMHLWTTSLVCKEWFEGCLMYGIVNVSMLNLVYNAELLKHCWNAVQYCKVGSRSIKHVRSQCLPLVTGILDSEHAELVQQLCNWPCVGHLGLVKSKFTLFGLCCAGFGGEEGPFGPAGTEPGAVPQQGGQAGSGVCCCHW